MTATPTELLRQHGVQVTAQRLAVMRAVSMNPHATADEICDVARSDIGAISRQSVYDALGLLTESGLTRRIQPIGSPARFEDRTGDNHHHVICRICGRVEDVDCAAGYAPCLDVVESKGFAIDEADVSYWGRCPQCLNQGIEPTLLSPPMRRLRSASKPDFQEHHINRRGRYGQ
jgi:Fur family ferric uptake transcriptional regulator